MRKGSIATESKVDTGNIVKSIPRAEKVKESHADVVTTEEDVLVESEQLEEDAAGDGQQESSDEVSVTTIENMDVDMTPMTRSNTKRRTVAFVELEPVTSSSNKRARRG